MKMSCFKGNYSRALVAAAAAVALAGLMVIVAARPAQARHHRSSSPIVFERQEVGGSRQIYKMSPDGSQQTKLTATGDNTDPAFSTNKRKIAFRHTDSGARSDIYSMNSDGLGQKNLTNATGSGVYYAFPSISSDGTKIAFTCETDDGNTDTSDVCVVNSDGTGFKKLTNTGSAGYAKISPDGTKVAFRGYDSANIYQIYVVNADGSGTPEKLTSLTESAYDPVFSPDGAKIAFDTAYTSGALYVMNSDGSGLKRLIDDGASTYESDLAFSPDGTQIAFTKEVDDDSNKSYYFLYVNTVPASGGSGGDSGESQLTTTGKDLLPTFSPDGKRIAFLSSRDGNGEIYSMSGSDGSKQTNLTKNAAEDDHPRWGGRQ